jgi:hypothetical protein
MVEKWGFHNVTIEAPFRFQYPANESLSGANSPASPIFYPHRLLQTPEKKQSFTH